MSTVVVQKKREQLVAPLTQSQATASTPPTTPRVGLFSDRIAMVVWLAGATTMACLLVKDLVVSVFGW